MSVRLQQRKIINNKTSLYLIIQFKNKRTKKSLGLYLIDNEDPNEKEIDYNNKIWRVAEEILQKVENDFIPLIHDIHTYNIEKVIKEVKENKIKMEDEIIKMHKSHVIKGNKEGNILPNHYLELEIDPIEYCIKNKISFVEGNIIKYVSRWKNKNGIEDLYKAEEYIKRLIKHEKSKGL